MGNLKELDSQELVRIDGGKLFKDGGAGFLGIIAGLIIGGLLISSMSHKL